MKKSASLYFEEFNIGDLFPTEDKRICEQDILGFAELTGDHNPIHTDRKFAEASLYGARVAHGLLGLSLVSGLAADLGFVERTTMAFRTLEWKFNQPIYIGDVIRAEFEVSRLRELPDSDRGLIIFKVSVLNQDGKMVQSGKWALVIKCKAENCQ